MYVKIHKTEKGTIIAACDDELIGKVITDGNKYMDLKKYGDFYKGEKTTEENLAKLLKGSFNSMNLVGKNVVSVAITTGIIGQNDVMYINGTPYIQIYSV